MYSIFALTLCSLTHFSVFGQEQLIKDFRYKDSANFEVKMNADFFLLGTFFDYMGRFAYVDRETQVDRYYPYEEFLAKYIVYFIEENYNIKVDTQFIESRHSEIFSRPIAEKLHYYYDEKGKLTEGIFDCEEKMYSFLTGALLRYGENIFDDVFLISVSNSPKRNEIHELLKSLECNKIIYKNYKGNIPTVTKFYFEATPRIVKYFNIIRDENKTIRSEYEKTIIKILENVDEKTFEEIKQSLDEQNKELENSLKIIFKM